MPAVEGTALAQTYAGRGLAVGDLFNNGKLDVVINVMDGVPALLRNVSPGQASLDRVEACRRAEESAGRCRRHRLSYRQQACASAGM